MTQPLLPVPQTKDELKSTVSHNLNSLVEGLLREHWESETLPAYLASFGGTGPSLNGNANIDKIVLATRVKVLGKEAGQPIVADASVKKIRFAVAVSIPRLTGVHIGSYEKQAKRLMIENKSRSNGESSTY